MSRPFYIFVLVFACLVAGLLPAVGCLRATTIACARASPTLLECVAREPTMFGVKVVTLPARAGAIQLVQHDEEDKRGWFLEAAPGGGWSQSVSERQGHVALQSFARFFETNGAAAFELKLKGNPLLLCLVIVGLVLLVWIAGPRTQTGQHVVLDVERNLFRHEQRRVLGRTQSSTRQLTDIHAAYVEAFDDESNESDVFLSGKRGKPKRLLRAMHYDCERVVAAIHSAVARARELHGVTEN